MISDIVGSFSPKGGSTSQFDEIVERFNNGTSLKKLKKKYKDIQPAQWDYFNGIKKGDASTKDWNKTLGKTSVNLGKFKDGLKLAAANMGAMLVVTLALKAAYAVFDHFNVSAQEQQEKVNELSSKMEDLQSQYDALQGKTLSADEQKELEYLKQRLDYTERQLKAEQELLAMKELYGAGDIFSDGNLEPTTYSNGATQASISENMSNSVDAMIDKLEKERELADNNAEWLQQHGYEDISGLYKNEAEQIDNLIAKRDEMFKQRDKYIESRALLQEKLNSGVLDGEEENRVKTDIEKYDAEIDKLQQSIDKVTLYVDVVPVLTEEQVNTKASLEEQFGTTNIKTLSDEDIEIAYKIENVDEMTFEQLLNAIEDIKDATKEKIEINISTSDYITGLEKLSDGFEKVSEIYTDVKDAGNFEFDNLANDSDFATIFKDVEGYQNFIDVISNSPDNIGACQAAFDDLVSSWIYGQEPLFNITEDTYDLTVAWLKQKGIQNAVEVADYALAESKKNAFIASHELTEGTEAEIQALLDEASAAGFSENAMYSLAVAIATADDSQLTFEQQIEAIYDIASAAGLASEALNSLITSAPADPSTIDFGSWSEAASKGQKALDAWYEAQQTKNQLTRVHDAFSNWLSQNKLEYKPTAKYGGSGSGSSGGGSGSASDPYKANIDKYKELSDAVENCETKITHINQALEHTDSVEAQIALNDKLIGVYKEQQDALTALNNARDKEIAQNVAKLRAKGFDVEYDPKSDNLKIKNIERLNQLAQDDIKTYETLINDTYDLNDANKEAAEQWTELSYSILDVNKQIKELQKQRYEDAVDDIDQMISLLEGSESTIGDTIPYYEKLMTNAITRIKDLVKDGFEANKDDIKDLMSDWMSYYDARIENEIKIRDLQQEDKDSILSAINDLFDSELEKIDKEIEALNKSNEERKAALELQKAQAALDAAKSQKVRKVLRQDVGFVYEADEDAVKEAEEALADIRFEESISALEKQKETLEELQNKWADIPELFEKHQNKLLAEQEFGANWEADILNDRKKAYEDFKDEYFNLQKEIYDLTEELNNKTNESYLQTMEVFKQMMNMYISAGNALGTTTSAHKAWYVNKDGKAPSQAQVGDIVYTKGGTYQITEKDENGKFTSQKINDTSTSIPEGLWGTEIKNNTADLTDVLGMNVLTNQDIIDSAKEHTDSILKLILGDDYLSKAILDNNKLTTDELASLLENVDSLDGNSISINDNTVEIGNAIYALDDLTYALNHLDFSSLKENVIEENEDITGALADFKDSMMSPEDQAYVKQLQAAWNTAKEQGNQELMDRLHELADAVREKYINGTLRPLVDGKDYNRVGADGYSTTFHENSRSDAYGGAPVAGIIGTTKSIWGLDASDKNAVQKLVDSGVLSAEDAKNLVQLSGGNQYDSDGTKKSTYKGQDLSGWDKQVISDSYSKSGETYWTTIKYTDPNTGQTVTKQEANAYTKEQVDSLRDSSKNIKENTNAVNGNIDAADNLSDAGYDVADSIAETGETIVSGVKDAVSNIEVDVNVKDSYSSGGSGSGGSGGGGGGGGSKSTYNASGNKEAGSFSSSTGSDGSKTTTYSGGSSGMTVTRTTDKNGKVTITVKDKNGTRTYAKGGINLDEGLALIDEKGKELTFEPDEGRYVRIAYGGNVIPADVSKNLWNFGINPAENIKKTVMGILGNSMSTRQIQTIQNSYHIDSIALPNVHDVNGFIRDIQNLPNLAKQYMTRKTT